MEYTIEQLIAMLPEAFLSDKSAGVDADIQLHLTGEEGGDYAVMIHDQMLRTLEGTVEHPNLEFTASAQDVIDIANRRLDPMRAFMAGKIKMTGDMRMAMSLISLFRMP
jgi:putative sterol carrier protein